MSLLKKKSIKPQGTKKQLAVSSQTHSSEHTIILTLPCLTSGTITMACQHRLLQLDKQTLIQVLAVEQYSEDHQTYYDILSRHFMVNRWEKVETVTDFSFSGFKITADGDCSHRISRLLFLGRKAMTNLDSVLKKAKTLLCQQRSIQSRLWSFQQSYTGVRERP